MTRTIENLLRDHNSTPIKKDEPKTRYFDFPRIQDDTAGSRGDEDSLGQSEEISRNDKVLLPTDHNIVNINQVYKSYPETNSIW